MRKFLTAVLCFFLSCFCFVGCGGKVGDNKYTHTEKITTVQDFERFFTYSQKGIYETKKYVGTGKASFSKFSVEITITPRIKGFVEYNGNVSFQVVANEGAVEGEHNGDIISGEIFYTGQTTITKVYESDEGYDDSVRLPYDGSTTSLRNDYSLVIVGLDITITYHHEGLSGDLTQTYKTITINQYNYNEYLFGKLKNSAYYVTVFYDTGEEIELTITGRIPESKSPIGTIVDVVGTIDVYPSATKN